MGTGLHAGEPLLRMQRRGERGEAGANTVLGRREVFRPGHGPLSFLTSRKAGSSWTQHLPASVGIVGRLQHAFTRSRSTTEAGYLLSKSLCVSNIFITFLQPGARTSTAQCSLTPEPLVQIP